MVLDMRIPLTKRYQQDVLDTAVSQFLAGELDAAGAGAGHRRWLERDHRRGGEGQAARRVRRQPWRRAIAPSTTIPEGLTVDGQAPGTRQPRRATTSLGAWRSDGAARWLFIWPTVLFILGLSLFPLVASLALSLSKLSSSRAASTSTSSGSRTTSSSCSGSSRATSSACSSRPSPLGWAIVIATVVLVGLRLDAVGPAAARSARSGSSSACSPACSWSASSGCSSRPWPARAAGPAR